MLTKILTFAALATLALILACGTTSPAPEEPSRNNQPANPTQPTAQQAQPQDTPSLAERINQRQQAAGEATPQSPVSSSRACPSRTEPRHPDRCNTRLGGTTGTRPSGPTTAAGKHRPDRTNKAGNNAGPGQHARRTQRGTACRHLRRHGPGAVRHHPGTVGSDSTAAINTKPRENGRTGNARADPGTKKFPPLQPHDPAKPGRK